jgi:hypothetical protein
MTRILLVLALLFVSVHLKAEPIAGLAKCAAYYVHVEIRGADTFSIHNVIMQKLYKSTSSTKEAQELYDLYHYKLIEASESDVNARYKPCLDLYLKLKLLMLITR